MSRARILVIGGSGRTGKLVIEEALRRGHPITAIVRNASSLSASDNLTIVEGSPLNEGDIHRAITRIPGDEPGVIVSTLGQTRKSGNPWAAITSPRRLMTDAMTSTMKVAKELKIDKVVAMSMFGAGESFTNLNFLMRWIMQSSNMSQTLEDQDLVDEEVKKSGLNFVLARPCMLKGETAAPVVFHGNEGEGAGFMPSISPQSVAGFLLDAAEQDTWDRSTPVISN